MKQTKQVIIIRRDLKMRRGKEISQGAHASMGALLSVLSKQDCGGYIKISSVELMSSPIAQWLQGSFTKITVTVQAEQELIDLSEKAKLAGIPYSLIEDNGKTEFNNAKTKTALAIGPWWSEDIDKITGHLPLY
jgi:PTH2 family peptidyl-tRNA hydrolase